MSQSSLDPSQLPFVLFYNLLLSRSSEASALIEGGRTFTKATSFTSPVYFWVAKINDWNQQKLKSKNGTCRPRTTGQSAPQRLIISWYSESLPRGLERTFPADLREQKQSLLGQPPIWHSISYRSPPSTSMEKPEVTAALDLKSHASPFHRTTPFINISLFLPPPLFLHM